MTRVKLFVYGTLRRGGRNYESFQNFLTFEKNDLLKGRLLDLGWYPGYLKDGEDEVVGEVYSLKEEDLSELDYYEGYKERNKKYSLFIRIEATTISGEKVYVYEFNKISDLNTKALTINPPDWLKYKKQVEFRAGD